MISRRQPSLSTPRRRRGAPWLLARVAALFLVGVSADATELNGKWNASAMRVTWSIGDWGQGCGPRPSGGGEAGGQVTLSPRGSEFVLRGLGRSYQSTSCWERMPGLAPRSHSASSTTIVTTCNMPAGDPRQAKVVTTWHLRGDKIYFDEAGQYQFLVKGHNCTASVRRTRLLEKVLPKDATAPKTEQTPAKKPTETEGSSGDVQDDSPANVVAPTAEKPPEPERTARCRSPGRPVRFEVSPSSKLMKAGEAFRFETIARDKQGCRVQVEANWSIDDGGTGLLLEEGGQVAAPPKVETGVARLEASLEGKSVEVTARVVSDAEYRRLLEGGEYGALGESSENATTTLLFSEVAVGQLDDEPSERDLLWLVAVATILVAGAAALLLWARSRYAAAEARATTGSFGAADSADSADSAKTGRAGSAEPAQQDTKQSDGAHAPARVCPLCGRTYPGETAFCGEDGARLVRSN